LPALRFPGNSIFPFEHRYFAHHARFDQSRVLVMFLAHPPICLDLDWVVFAWVEIMAIDFTPMGKSMRLGYTSLHFFKAMGSV
jgi:hypothetical protein